jgi:hypothetical protein
MRRNNDSVEPEKSKTPSILVHPETDSYVLRVPYMVNNHKIGLQHTTSSAGIDSNGRPSVQMPLLT